MVKYILLILLSSISFSQSLIEKKEYKFYKSKDTKEINIIDLINEEDGAFEVELIDFNDSRGNFKRLFS